jgi:hypothetical protein
LFAQRVPHYQLALDLLLHHRQYIELEHDLKAAQDLSASDRACYNGILANRKNDVSDSIHLLEPLARTIAQGSIDRAEVVLCTLADDYAKSFRYGDAADTYSLLSGMPGYGDDESGCHAKLEAERAEHEPSSKHETRSRPVRCAREHSVLKAACLALRI